MPAVTAADRATNPTAATFRLTRDADPPQVQLTVPRRVYTTSIPLAWGASDESGVARYDVQVRVEGGDWTTWLSGTLATQATYAATSGRWFTFRVIATDNVGNSGSVEATSSLARVTKYYYHAGRRVAMRRGGVVYYLHGDHLGSTSLVTSQTASVKRQTSNVVARQLFLPYGDTRWQEGTFPTDFGFAGQRGVPGAGLVFMHARYYDAGLGRFVSADTVVPGAGEPQPLNRYAYGVGNPVKYNDPSGHDPMFPLIEGVGSASLPGPVSDPQRAVDEWLQTEAGRAYARYWWQRYDSSAEGKALWSLHATTDVDNIPFSVTAAEYHAYKVLGQVWNPLLNNVPVLTPPLFPGSSSSSSRLGATPSWSAVASHINSAGGLDTSANWSLPKLMSNAQVRRWYNEQIEQLDTEGPLTREFAEQVCNQRNTIKAQARALMVDRDAALFLDQQHPIQSFEYYVQKYSTQGYSGEALWARIIQGSVTPNPEVNARFGIK